MEKIKAFLAKVKLFFGEVKSVYDKVVAFVSTKVFIFTYPLAVLAIIAICTGSIFVFFAFAIWLLVTVIHK
jgi:hypothetical protein